MGDPRKSKSKYATPKKPWQKERLDAEIEIVKEYGVVNKGEIHKMRSMLRDFALRAKKLLSSTSSQAEQEKKALISKLHSLALTGKDAQLDDILALQLKNILERRLQTLVFRKGLANTIKQARQFIVHQHILVGSKVITAPSYIVSKEEEAKLVFAEKSPFANPLHPERPEQIHKMKESKKKKPKAEVKEAIEEIKEEKKVPEKDNAAVQDEVKETKKTESQSREQAEAKPAPAEKKQAPEKAKTSDSSITKKEKSSEGEKIEAKQAPEKAQSAAIKNEVEEKPKEPQSKEQEKTEQKAEVKP